MKRTPLYEAHKRAGAKFVDFGGWEMPVSYTGVLDEHRCVRSAAGLFDVSHMGEIVVKGPDAEEFLNFVTTNDVRMLVNGKAQYTIACYEDGGCVDDLIIYRRHHDDFLLCVNASNTEKDFDWFEKQSSGFNVTLSNESSNFAQIALQGPKSDSILQPLVKTDLGKLGSFHFLYEKVGSVEVLIARTGYTGDGGFELYLPSASAEEIWELLMSKGRPKGLKPCGLGARDTLRLEMAYPLYGHELGKDITPIEAGLKWVVKLNKGDFLGKARIQGQLERGTERKLVGLVMEERGIPREGYPLVDGAGKAVGKVTSGTMSPSLEKPIALGFLPPSLAEPGSEVFVEIRGKSAKAKVVQTPFIKKH